MSGRETSSEIDQRAAQWALLVDHEELSEQENMALEAWMSADLRRRGCIRTRESGPDAGEARKSP